MIPCCDPDLEDSNNNKNKIHIILLLMMLHHHTQFGNKMFCDSENIIQTTFTDLQNLHCDFDLKHSNPIFPPGTLAYDAVLSNQVWLQTNQQFRRNNRYSHMLIIVT